MLNGFGARADRRTTVVCRSGATGGASLLVTLTMFVITPSLGVLTTMETIALSGNSPRWQVTTPFPKLQSPAVELADTNLTVGGKRLVRTTSAEGTAPRFATVKR